MRVDFFGPDRMVFATDTPYDNEFGERVYRETIPAVEAMPVSDAVKQQIFEGNARRLFRLDVTTESVIGRLGDSAILSRWRSVACRRILRISSACPV